MKTTPRPSSPTSLLWAHQLKREHGHLIGRLQQVESANRQQEDRIKKAESAAKAGTNNDIAALADQVKALDEGGINKRLAKVEKDVMAKLDDVQAESEAMVLKVASLEKDDVLVEEERRKAFNKEKALLKRVGEVEESLKLYEAGLESVGRRVDDASISTIKAQLDSLVGQVRKEGAEMKRLEDSISVLEAANEELRKANERLAAEMEKVAAKPTLTPLVQTVVEAAADEAASPEDVTEQPELEDDGTLKRRKKKSHKWAGGGADRDIIRQASDVVHKVAAPPRRTLTPKAVAKPKAIAKPKEVSKKGVATKEVAKPARKSQGFLDGDADKPIIRAGKGWVEVAMTPSQSEQESQESSVKRPRGRPRKQPRPDTLEDLGQDTQRVTRGGRQSLGQAKTVPQKRKLEPEGAAAGTQKFRPSDAMRQAKAAQNRAGTKRKEPYVISSPISSPASPPLPPSSPPASPLDYPPPAKRRRVIEQPDNGALLRQYA